jgi:F-type H+-transporting ATPase subunit b
MQPLLKRVIDLDYSILFSAAEELRPPVLFELNFDTLTQIGLNLFNVAVLALVLALVLYKPVRKVLKKRTDRIQGELDHAAKEMADATELKTLYEQKMQEIDREREEILVEARKLAADSGRRITADAKKEAEHIIERANASVEAEWQRTQTEMRTAIIDVSAVMAEKFVKLAINKETHDKLFEETVSDLEEMSWKS